MKKWFLVFSGILFVFVASSQTNNNKINFDDVGCIKYKYKTISADSLNNKSLFHKDKEDENLINFTDLLIKSVKEYGVSGYSNKNFREILIFESILNQMGERTDTIMMFDENREIIKEVEKTEYKVEDVIAYNIKEL